MQNFVRLGIVTLAGTVGIGGAAIVVSSLATADDPAPAKREDTATTWVVDADDDGKDDRDDGPSRNSGASTLSKASVNPAPKAQVNSNSGNASPAPKAKPKVQVNSNSGGGNSNSGGGNSNSGGGNSNS